MRVTSFAATVFVLAAPALAFGQEEETSLQANGSTGRAEDANVDRGVLLSTAETQPTGSVTVSNYDLSTVGVTYGVTDDLQVGTVVVTPLFDHGHDDWFGALSAKYKVLKDDRIRVAVQATAGSMIGEEFDGEYIYMVGGIGSFCLDAKCRSLLTGNVSWLGFAAGDSAFIAREQNLVGGLSWVQAVHPMAKFLVEVIGVAHHDATGWEMSDSVLINYGFRATSGQVSGEVGFLKPTKDDGEFFPGLPFFSFSYRMM